VNETVIDQAPRELFWMTLRAFVEPHVGGHLRSRSLARGNRFDVFRFLVEAGMPAAMVAQGA
jgi:hypothetical protein